MKLEPGEIICDKCEGTGVDPSYGCSVFGSRIFCRKCGGYGKLNWTETIFGKTNYDYDDLWFTPN